MQTEQPRFMQRQFEFAARIRDPHNAPAPLDVDPRRMAAYEELFFNNIRESISNAFPVLRRIHDEGRWEAMLRDFFIRHHAYTPLFHELPREFLHYLEHERGGNSDYPFLNELAHYEWLELELLGADEALPPHDSNTDLLDGCPVLSPLIRLCHYNWAVHRIGPDYLPQRGEEQTTHLLLYRDESDQIAFLALNPVSAHLVAILQQGFAQNGRELLRQIAAELNHPNPKTVMQGGVALLQEFKQRRIILGTRR